MIRHPASASANPVPRIRLAAVGNGNDELRGLVNAVQLLIEYFRSDQSMDHPETDHRFPGRRLYPESGIQHLSIHHVPVLPSSHDSTLPLFNYSTLPDLTAYAASLRAPYDLPCRRALKNLNVFANSIFSSPKTTNACKGFTGRILKNANVLAPPYGFTACTPQGTPHR